MSASQYLKTAKRLIEDPKNYSTEDRLVDENGELNAEGVRNSLGALDFNKAHRYAEWEVARQLLVNSFFRHGKDMSEESDSLTHTEVMQIWTEAIQDGERDELEESLEASGDFREDAFAALDKLVLMTSEGCVKNVE